jgi:uncharacterized protein (TIGR03435 family)
LKPADTAVFFRQLLVDRFRLTTHTAMRDMPIDVLTVAEEGKLGPRLTPRQQRCENPPANGRGTTARGAPPACGMRVAFGRISGIDVPMADLTTALIRMTRRVVVDRTGLTGRYDFVLQYTPDAIAFATDPANARAAFPNVDPDAPILATALREQLGLKIQATRGPVEVLVVDRLERPSLD